MKAELTKGDVYVVVDTPKKAKKLKKLLDMFGEEVYEGKVFHDDGYPYYTYISGSNLFVGCKYEKGSNISDKTKVSIKELRNILAKENLRSGDYIVATIGKIKYLVEFGGFGKKFFILGKKYLPFSCIGNNAATCEWGAFEDFKRYAKPKEIALLEPQNGLCPLYKSKLGIK